MTALSTLLEWGRDWADRDTYDAVMDTVKTHLGGTASVWSTPTHPDALPDRRYSSRGVSKVEVWKSLHPAILRVRASESIA